MKKKWFIVVSVFLALAGCSSEANKKSDYSNYKGIWMDSTGNTVVELDFENGKDTASVMMKQNNGISSNINVSLTKEEQKKNAYLLSDEKGEFVFNDSASAILNWKNGTDTVEYSLIPYDPKKVKTNNNTQIIYNGERVIKNQLELIGDTNYQISFADVQTENNEEVYRYILIPTGQQAGSVQREAFFNPKTGNITFQKNK